MMNASARVTLGRPWQSKPEEEVPLNRLGVALVVCALFAVTVSADPPPFPEFAVYNRTPFTINGEFTFGYTPPGNTGTQYASISDAIAPNDSRSRNTPTRFPGTLSGAGSVVLLAMADRTGVRGARADFSTGGTSTFILGTYPDGKLQLTVCGGWSSGSMGCGSSTGASGRDYIRLYLDWVK
jgi:hypothetical protein